MQQLREWIDEQGHIEQSTNNENITDILILSTTKACPSCGFRSTHYHGHQCHHITPARPPKRGGCPNCHINYCYRCGATEIENAKQRGNVSHCKCTHESSNSSNYSLKYFLLGGYWSSFCAPITSIRDAKLYVKLNNGIPYDSRCGCVICSDCRFNRSCEFCPGDCVVCR